MNRIAVLATSLWMGAATLCALPERTFAAEPVSPSNAWAHQPLGFEPNVGQTTNRNAQFIARSAGYDLELRPDGIRRRVAGHGAVSQLSLIGANSHSTATADRRLPGVVNYLTGTQRAQWHTEVPTFQRVTYQGVYAGVDAVYHGEHGQLEYDFEVHPGVDPRIINIGFMDAAEVTVEAASGDLLVKDRAGVLARHSRPVVYQWNGDTKVAVTGAYRLVKPRVVAFDVGAHDPSRTLIIDPTITLTRFLAGPDMNMPVAITADASGASYLTGTTNGRGYVAKFASNGTLLITTLFGGTGTTTPRAIAVDYYNVYVAGGTTAPRVTTANGNGAYVDIRYDQNTPAGVERAFVTRFSLPLTSLSLTTILGSRGNSEAHGLFVDGSEQAYVVGQTCGGAFPVTVNVGFAGCDAFVAKLDTYGYLNGGYATVIGGLDSDDALAVAVNSVGEAWVTGHTCSYAFPTANPALNHGYAGVMKAAGPNCAAFVTKYNPSGTFFLYSMVIGGNPYTTPHDTFMDDRATAIVLDGDNGAYIAGTTHSPNFYTTTNGVVQAANPCGGNPNCQSGFVSYITAGFTTLYSTYLGGAQAASAYGIARNAQGEVYVTGQTAGYIGFPGAPAITPNPTAGFVTKLAGNLSSVGWTQFLGDSVTGIAARNASTRLGSLFTTLYTTGTRMAPGSTLSHRDEDGFLVTMTDSSLVIANPPCCIHVF